MLLTALLPLPLAASDTPAASLAAEIRETRLDPAECYRVRDLSFTKEDVRLYLTEGYLIFGQPVRGKRIFAVFSGHIEGGDGEILVMPPLRSERLSLATFTKSPNLNEHFRAAVMLFTDGTAEELAGMAQSRPRVQKSPEMGAILEQQWSPVVGNFSSSFGMRLLYDLLSGNPASSGFFYAAISGNSLGNFDVIYDPESTEQVHIGQLKSQAGGAFFDTWASFQSRSFRGKAGKTRRLGNPLTNYRIDATLHPDLELRAVTKADVTTGPRPQRVFYFDIAPSMRVTEVTVNGEACEVWQHDSLREDLLRGRGNGLFLVVAPEALEPNRTYEIDIHHEGTVVREAGRGVYFVGARGSWYPRQGWNFAYYDVTFRYPSNLDLVFNGEILEDRTEGEWHIMRRKTESLIRLAGFNVGEYEHVKATHDGYNVEVYANRRVEKALEPHERIVVMPRSDSPWNRRPQSMPDIAMVPSALPRPDPTARLESLAKEIGDVFGYMAGFFGPPPSRTLTVSPIPGTFGQGFPGLLYLSTVTYLDPAQRPTATRDPYHEFFFSEILHAHETAHQWWGNVVSTNGYQDEWLMEALANYSALLVLEKRKGEESLRKVLDFYRQNLLAKNESGRTVDSAGPITWGPRLDSSRAQSWRTITYEKGSWIMHMLRRKLGDERFMKMLGEICRRYWFKSITTDEFRELAAEFLPKGSVDPTLEIFFDNWVYDVGIPKLQFNHSIKGAAPNVRITGTVTQSDVAKDFSVYVPIEIRGPGKASVTRWVRTADEPVPFEITVRQRPAHIVFNPGDTVLAVNPR